MNFAYYSILWNTQLRNVNSAKFVHTNMSNRAFHHQINFHEHEIDIYLYEKQKHNKNHTET